MFKFFGPPEDEAKRIKHSRVAVTMDGHFCCLIDIQGWASTITDPWESMCIGVVTCRTRGVGYFNLRDRVKMAWMALRGNLWGHDIELNTKADYERFMQAMREVAAETWSNDGTANDNPSR